MGFRITDFQPGKDPLRRDIPDPLPPGFETSDEWKNPEAEDIAPVLRAYAARWQEHGFRWWSNVGIPGQQILDGQCLELARFDVPPGKQGVINRIETSIMIVDEQSGDINFLPYFFTPYWFDVLAVGAGTPLPASRYFLRLEGWNREGLPVDQRRLFDRDQLPGIPHPDLGSWDDMRYDFSRTPGAHVRLGVGEAQRVTLWQEWRLFGDQRDIPFLRNCGGRLAGVTQVFRHNPTAETEARTFPNF